jgi:hypothetical protein
LFFISSSPIWVVTRNDLTKLARVIWTSFHVMFALSGISANVYFQDSATTTTPTLTILPQALVRRRSVAKLAVAYSEAVVRLVPLLVDSVLPLPIPTLSEAVPPEEASLARTSLPLVAGARRVAGYSDREVILLADSAVTRHPLAAPSVQLRHPSAGEPRTNR